jgi:hypothetical protein
MKPRVLLTARIIIPIGLMLSLPAVAGTTRPSPEPAPPPVSTEEEAGGLLGGIGLEASMGWDSHYIFRGELLQENTVWTQLSYDLELTDSLSLNITPWFLQDVDTDYNEFDLTSALTYSLDPWEFSAGYAGYYYPRKSLGGNEGIGDEQEITGSIGRSFGDLTATLMGAYSITRDGFYYELALEYEVGVTDALTLIPGVVLGWDTDYFADGTDVNHVALRLAANYQLTPWCAVSPYVAGNLPFGHLEEDYREDFYGGVSLTVGF